MRRESGIRPDGSFAWGLHQPRYGVRNLRAADHFAALGATRDGTPVENRANFPSSDVAVAHADGVYEIPNALPFRGVTYIGQRWAEGRAEDPSGLGLPPREACRFLAALDALGIDQPPEALVGALPQPLKLALATTSTDPRDLVALARTTAEFVGAADAEDAPSGLLYEWDAGGHLQPVVHDAQLYDAVANNPNLPDAYKEVMVLRPGIQGGSEIVGEWKNREGGGSRIFEYLRTNSYIPWGHFAANMAHDTVRYDAAGLTATDVQGLRGLYYQRTYVRLAEQLAIPLPPSRRPLVPDELEALRCRIVDHLQAPDAPRLTFNAALWGWNYGYDFAPTRYRLHASHQQIHQQFALIPRRVPLSADPAGTLPSYACGDLVADLCHDYRRQHRVSFFDAYLQAIRANTRMDGRDDRETALVVYESDGVMLFVPKAQTSQWELQIMPTRPIGNVLEADAVLRTALDATLLLAVRILAALGARMVTVIEYGKRFDTGPADQHLLYALLPRLPESPGAFSEAQLRWISGHYPEDFAGACRKALIDLPDLGR
ncbi:MAG: hypothetical protein QNJ22_21690 [Desulfosarcinaceae bacterium]|nr:hypothetical protein [Desulfosarcinaceae bacterium]